MHVANNRPKLVGVLVYSFGCLIWIAFGGYWVFESGGRGWAGGIGWFLLVSNGFLLARHWAGYLRKRRAAATAEQL